MGCFDSVVVECPDCHEKVEFQSKAGDCILAVYDNRYVPENIAKDLNRQCKNCENCGKVITLEIDYTPPNFTPMRVK